MSLRRPPLAAALERHCGACSAAARDFRKRLFQPQPRQGGAPHRPQQCLRGGAAREAARAARRPAIRPADVAGRLLGSRCSSRRAPVAMSTRVPNAGATGAGARHKWRGEMV